jgi:hypothetical protein
MALSEEMLVPYGPYAGGVSTDAKTASYDNGLAHTLEVLSQLSKQTYLAFLVTPPPKAFRTSLSNTPVHRAVLTPAAPLF